MNWHQLLNPKRLGKDEPEDFDFTRTPFQKDYDKLIFSSAFRRLKDKTQVFSLVKNDYVRTRLIHSLEVSCVGRSLSRFVGKEIIKRSKLKNFICEDFGDIVAAACIAHDIGNPPFGHSGEDAIRNAFRCLTNQTNFIQDLTKEQKNDFDWFEGNAQGFRILTYIEEASIKGGMQLTYPTLAAFTKYPRESLIPNNIIKDYTGRSILKYGFFQSEKSLFTEIAKVLGLIKRSSEVAWWARHPLTFLVEAADDICYSIVDIEDAYRMGYIPFQEVKDLLNQIAQIDLKKYSNCSEEEQVKYLRSKAINRLIMATAEIFLDHEQELLSGTFDKALLSQTSYAVHLKIIEQKTAQLVFFHPDVVRIQVAGYEVLGTLFTKFVNAIFSNSRKDKLLLLMLPQKYRAVSSENSYQKISKIIDYISGMTDSYATSLFQQIQGISLE
ncbi:deoxyguanosinetriphosphate triphosphohydrolase (plasmid) [Geminocystis sp. NIES-3708]|uniref:deoxyguanosinetriphosphate triphosphohydrolase n=1 Tax=Geminocystis sp. NIES-3708 TaxID=1615909 RepID=UPI0005FC8417|nr:deoxyguanosinetriphosphate triphosphohydrolase [Geminocystis sp. NIES-3708]BAQ63139.1 deoxyguanosinetriphosphate triphosphohydrolase [Geminocystis sp. NIES-3708]